MFTKFNPLVGGGTTPDGFTVANVSTLAPLLGLTTQTNAATKVIRFFRGFDMLNDVSNGIVGASGSVVINGISYARPIERSLSTYGTKSGWWKMGDIYHSTPGIVFAGGDLRGSPTYSPGANSAYDTYFANIKPRKRVIIAGANDGFIHAFDAGTPITGTDPIIYSKGNGEELWAYAPSHLLPKIGSAIVCPNDVNSACEVSATKYNYYVDGSPMIRDAYLATGTSDRGNTTTFSSSAYADRWKTVMVVGDRDGGTRFTALDVTDPVNPKFLWEFPTVISTAINGRAEPAALTWSDVFPNPAPILPVVFDGDNNLSTTADRYTRFVVLLNGGFSRNQTGGRGVYMVDARDGTLLWKFEYSTADAERQAMRYSFAAPVAGVPFPITSKSTTMAIAVDTGGQVWQFDFTEPGMIPVGGIAQWTGKRIFSTAVASATTQAYAALPDTNATISAAEYPYRGMYSLVAAGYVYSEVETGGLDLWTYVGTGDRDLVGNPNVAHTSGVALDGAIVDASCGRAPYDGFKFVNRFYGLNLSKGRKVASQPNTEDDLSPLNTQASYGEVQTLAQPSTFGWYLMLRPGEKVNNAPYLFNRGVYFTTYQPTGSCLVTGTSTIDSCESPSGVGRLYALDYMNGRPIVDFNTGGGGVNFGNIKGVTTTSADTSLALGAGLPTTSAVTVAVGNGKQSAAMLLSTSNDPTPKAQRANVSSTLVRKVWSLLISESLHTTLPGLGSQH
jgi:Tfp pilus tip-associated adhesin PilY1